MKYVIIGGVAGGATAAARLRRNDERAEIVLIEKGKYISYANCGLPYYIGGVITQRDNLFLQTPESFGRRFNMAVKVEHEALRIDRQGKYVEVRRPDGTVFHETYDRLLLSPGALPVVPPLPGIDSEGVFTLRNIADTDAIKQFIDTHDVKRAVVVGGGFIGLEMAENLHERGISVSLVEMAPQVMAPIDFSMANLVHQHMAQKGVGLYLGQAVQAIERAREGGLEVLLNTTHRLSADLVLLSIGVRPNTALAAEADLELGQTRGIKVNEYLQTSDADIYAVGDAIEFPHPLTGKPWLNYLAGPANRQARLAADNMSGAARRPYEGALGTAIAKVFDLTVAATGLAAKALQREAMPYRSVTLMPNSHAGYYPGATPLTLKVTFDAQTGRLFGAQAVGISGADKRIDAIAQLLKHNGTIEDLMQTEQAYAPSFSSAKDPLAMAGYIADNILTGKMKPLYWRDLQAASPDDTVILDVRTAAEYETGRVKGAINIPVDELRERLAEIPTGKTVMVYCAVGLRGYLASNILRQNGFDDVRNLIGGYRLYSTAVADFSAAACDTPAAACPAPQPQERQPSVATALTVDACGLCCPGPIMKLKQGVDQIATGESLTVKATDPGFVHDAAAWCETTGHRLVETRTEGGTFTAVIEKNSPAAPLSDRSATVGKGKTLILFSDDLDKALATFVLANGAAATGERVSIFFTFWGLNAIKKAGAKAAKKDLWGRMFAMMLPKDSRGLALSKMNMGGLGAKMMRMVMKQKGVDSLETLRAEALANGVEFIACQMSMDVMGIAREELLDEVNIGGVATYMNRAEQANVNLFI